MKTIVFGGSGLLGSHVADALTEAGNEVAVFDLRKSNYLRKGQQMILGNILDADDVSVAVEGMDVVYNFAGLANLDSAATRPVDTVMLNIVGTCNILDACVAHHVKRFVYASSFYANSGKGGFYRCSKQAAEIYIEEYARKYNLSYTVLRYGSLYGPRAGKENGIFKMIQNALSFGKVPCAGRGEEVREYIHVKDAAALSVQILGDEYRDKHIVLTDLQADYTADNDELHYVITPYTYRPAENYKLVGNLYRDFGQGLTECIRDMKDEAEG